MDTGVTSGAGAPVGGVPVDGVPADGVPGRGRRLLLHACCGPCSIVPLGRLLDEGWDVTLCYVNPNIEPRAEYDRRLSTLFTWAGLLGVPVIEGPRDHDAWERRVAPHDTDRPARCEACYRLRLRQSAQIAAREGFEAMATTLAVSPYQLLSACNRQLGLACAQQGLEPVARDFRAEYPRAVRESLDLGMYRQSYCGCRFSAAEAALGRVAAREQRRMGKDVKRAQAGRAPTRA